MAILTFNVNTPGLQGVSPRRINITTNDTIGAITATGYLNFYLSQLFPTDFVEITYIDNAGNQASNVFTLSISGNNVTLVNSEIVVDLPVTSGNFAMFSSNGAIVDNGFHPTSTIQKRVVNSSGNTVAGHIASFSDGIGSLTDAIPSNGKTAQQVLYSYLNNPDTSSNIFSITHTLTFQSLISMGHPALIQSSGTKQFRILFMMINRGNTNFSGGISDVQITDGVATQYAIITQTALTTHATNNFQWGDTDFPSSVTANSAGISAPGANIFFQYINHSADYNNGALIMTAWCQRVA